MHKLNIGLYATIWMFLESFIELVLKSKFITVIRVTVSDYFPLLILFKPGLAILAAAS